MKKYDSIKVKLININILTDQLNSIRNPITFKIYNLLTKGLYPQILNCNYVLTDYKLKSKSKQFLYNQSFNVSILNSNSQSYLFECQPSQIINEMFIWVHEV